MAPKNTHQAYEQLRRQISQGVQLANVYLLHGEEGFYIDQLVKAFEEMLPEDVRAFDSYVVYGSSTQPEQVDNLCHNYPVFGQRLLVIVKEIQNWKDSELEKLIPYIENPVQSTLLVLACRGKAVKSKKIEKAMIASHGEMFESPAVKDRNVTAIVGQIIKSRGLNIEEKGLTMLCEYVGSDISRIYQQIDKLTVALERGAMITPEVIERNVGISKDYNLFELSDAVSVRDGAKALRIIEYFRANPKANPAVPVPAILFTHFSNLLIYHFTRDKSPDSIMATLGLKWSSQADRVARGARFYNARQVIEIISALREADRNLKGMGSRQDPYDILRDLLFVILNCRGIQ